MRFGILICIVSLLVACSSKKNQVQPAVPVAEAPKVQEAVSDTMLYYSRGACFGMCPIFELTVMKDGRAVYLGKNHVDRIGRFQAMVSFTDIEQVVQKANEIGYFDLNSVYDNDNVQDLPDIKTGIAQHGKLHSVRNRYKGPAALRMLYTQLDSLIEKQTWKPAGASSQE
jgi:hypothetical protein